MRKNVKKTKYPYQEMEVQRESLGRKFILVQIFMLRKDIYMNRSRSNEKVHSYKGVTLNFVYS